jgi:hypothetical protein
MQIQGAVVFALTAALHGEITIKNGGAEQSNFHDYQMLRIAAVPKVETVIVPTVACGAASASRRSPRSRRPCATPSSPLPASAFAHCR